MPQKQKNSDGSISEVFDVQAVGVKLTDRSGTVLSGGTSQVLSPANPFRKGFRLQNQSAGDLWLNDKGGAATASQPSFKVSAGTLYESPLSGAPIDAISVFGATTGQAFESSEF